VLVAKVDEDAPFRCLHGLAGAEDAVEKLDSWHESRFRCGPRIVQPACTGR
jgi:hypothetical protein